jgi:hypothetical protein
MVGVKRRHPSPSFSLTPAGKPHFRIVHIPYGMGSIDAEGCRNLFTVCDGCRVTDYALMRDPLGRNPMWVFVVDTSGETFADEAIMPDGFDYRRLLSGLAR